MPYVPPKFKDANGSTFEGNIAWEEALERTSNLGLLAIPNRPFSGKPIKIAVDKNPPDGDYRKPLTKSEFKLLRKVMPGLSIRVVDSIPELSDPRLELFLREYYNMGDSRICTLTWSNIFDACKSFVAKQENRKDAPAKNNTSQEMALKPLLSERQLEIWNSLAGKCLSAKEIGKLFDLNDENIRKHIQAIRKKFGQEAIRTTHSRGYWRLDDPPSDNMHKV